MVEQLVASVGPPEPVAAGQVAARIFALAAEEDGPSLSRYIARQATLDQFREFVIHRSAYQLKEADPHTFAIPRIGGRRRRRWSRCRRTSTAAAIPSACTRGSSRRTMEALGLDSTYGAYIGELPAATLGDRQPDHGLRPAPALARRAGRPPGRLRDHLARAQPPLRQRPAPARLRRRGDRVLRRARRGRLGAREHRRLRPRRQGSPAKSLSSPATSCSACARCCTARSGSPVAPPRCLAARRELPAQPRGVGPLSRAQRSGCPAAALSARKSIDLCVPSQKGFVREPPQRQSAIVSRRLSITLPS